MVREPPPRRNDAALLSKIASQEKLRAELPSSPPSPFLRVNPLCPGTPSPRATAWFLLQESIPWLQESGGFYVKILQKIMARYIYFPPALRLLVALHSSPFPFSYIVLRFSVRRRTSSPHAPRASMPSGPFDRITMHQECIPLIASPPRSASTGERKLVGR